VLIAPGSRLGPYEVLSLIGSGGMGEVYKARDTRLDRTVAIKILAPQIASAPELRIRFEREARAVASLSHPNICTLHDVGHQDGTEFLVMEYLEGQTLEQRLKKGPLPFDQAFRITIQIADALMAAHRAGVVHRDLKPGNIIVTKSGAKLLDFGLAKLHQAALSGGAFLGEALTIDPALTGHRSIVGTLQYLAPEQLNGEDADPRTDIFAFGALLYEIFTGTRAFDGRTPTSVIAAILEHEPAPVSTLQAMSPRALDRIADKCLAKDRDLRWQSSRDLYDELVWVNDHATRLVPIEAAARVGWRERMAWLVAVIAIGALVVFALVRPPAESPVIRTEVVTPPTVDPASFALSPDGRQLAFVANADTGPKLWLRPLDQAAVPLAGTEGASAPFWAPDSRALGFFADGKLKRVDLNGGLPRILADAPLGRGGTWNRDGVIVFAPMTTGALLQLLPGGSKSTAITQLEQTGHQSHRWPQLLPDGRRLLFFATNGPEPSGVYLGSLDGTPPTRLLATTTAAVYASEYLLAVDQSLLTAWPFDVDRRSLGDPIPVARRVGSDENLFVGAFSVSMTGLLAHRVTIAGERQLVWVTRTGTRVSTVGLQDENNLLNPALSPDGKRVAVQRTIDGNADTWVLDDDSVTRVTLHPKNDNAPVWSPDGRRLIFRSNRSGAFDLYEKLATGPGTEQPVLTNSQNKFPLDWSIDGRILLYQVLDPSTGFDLWAMPLLGERKPFVVVQTRFNERNGELAPNGRWLAYDSNEPSGRSEVYVQPFPNALEKSQISTGGGVAPRWRRDGKELFYIAPDGSLMAVPVRTSADDQALELGAAVRLFRVPIVFGGSATGGAVRQQYEVSPDGERFLVNVAADEAATPITIVQNWPASLRK
jgi:eukaryotic-like serine/threonine-protein kinase